MKKKRVANKVARLAARAGKRRAVKKRPTVGRRIIQGLQQAVAWTRGEDHRARVTLVKVPEIDVREVRQKMALARRNLPQSLVSRQRLSAIGSKAGLARMHPHECCLR